MKKDTTPPKGDIKAFLGPGSQFEGTLVFDEVVRIDGEFRGEIRSKDVLIVGETAVVNGDINVGTLVLSGRLQGTVIATDKVELLAPANLEGTVTTPILMVEKGVVFNGTLSMGAKGELPQD